MTTFLRRILALALLAPALALGAEPYAIAAHGNFKRMAHTGNTDGVVKLSALGAGSGRYGVGALAGLRGEILQWDGKLLVSRGHDERGRTEAPRESDAAVLFAGATVPAWQELEVPADMAQAEFEAFVLTQAKARGLDVERGFPFTVVGETFDLVWHVVTGPATGGHGASGAHKQGHAGQRVFKESNAAGRLLGFHSGAALEGVISHPGERFHVHYANADLTVSGHVDEYRVRRGSKLGLPLKG